MKTELVNQYYKQLNAWCESHQPQTRLQYQVPLLGEGGTCSLFGELDETPYNLATSLDDKQLSILPQVQSLVDWVAQNANVDWFGVYLTRETEKQEKVLTKLAYFGAESRAEFPVNAEFAEISNNSKVGLTGEYKTINDVDKYVRQGGEYYTCDPKVKSELCWPIIAEQSFAKKSALETGTEQKILGIIDAECFHTDQFDEDRQALFTAVNQKLSVLFSQLN